MSHRDEWFGPEELDAASKAIVRARFLLDLCGAFKARSRHSPGLVADVVVSSIALGCRDEDKLVKVAVDHYLMSV